MPPRSWNDLFADPRFHWKKPDAGVASTSRHWADEGRRLIWDLGCGAGRHMAFLLSAGFDVVGTDVSQNGLRPVPSALRQQICPHDLPAPT